MNARDSALALVGVGLAVFPVNANKVPLVKGWTTGAATNADDVQRLWRVAPDAPCVGISTGQSGLSNVN